jgi:AmmeMemoRadiSam system protein A
MNDTLGRALLVRARNAIAGELGIAPLPEPEDPALGQVGAVFVTLMQDGRLRGCIGSLEAHRQLDDDVRANARAAAFRDPRFAPLDREELPHTRVEVSLLSAAVPIAFSDEEDAVSQLRPGVDGVILEWHGRRGTFLPQVWESLPERHQFVAHLKQKAGLPADFWAPDVKLYRYEVEKWKEPMKS